jgi:hypothetical protein
MTLSALHPAELRDIVTGGGQAMDALARRIATTKGDVSMELYQLADRATVEALVQRGLRDDAVHVLGDARLVDGGFGDELAFATRAGSWRTYDDGGEFWQHAKTYHLTGPDGPETWITNLAPIPDTVARSELALVLGGDAARAARAVTDASIGGDRRAIQSAIDAAAGAGVLYNDPLAQRRSLADGLSELVNQRHGDLVVVTKGIENAGMTDALIAATRAGRDVQVYVRDIARSDAERLAAAAVPTWVVSGGLKPRINAVFSGDRAIVGSAFLWDNMVGDAAVTTARDAGAHLAGPSAARARAATMASMREMPEHVPLETALASGAVPEHI